MRAVVLILGVLFSVVQSFSHMLSVQDAIENSLTVVTREATRQVDSIVGRVQSSLPARIKLDLSVANHPDKSWLELIAVRAVESRENIELVSTNPNVRLEIVVKDMSTRYERTEDADSVYRVITVAIEALMKGESQVRIAPHPFVLRERCLRSDAMAEQSLQLESTHADLPEASRGMFEEILEPAIFITAAVVTVVLAFTVRSK